jgi:protein-L-isoaspartate(D-aspartate) O-methyltransferase
MDDPAGLRAEMVDSLAHESKGLLTSERVVAAMRAIPRHEFVDEEHRAYLDQSFEARGSTVLAPSTVARLVEGLDPESGDDVLVVGAGVGYTAAVLAAVAGGEHVHAVDIDRGLVLDARRNLARAGHGDVLVDCRDGAEGLPGYAPFDRVLVEAAAVRPPAALLDQLAPDGRLVMPLGAGDQQLAALRSNGEEWAVVEELGPVGFAPLLVEGEQFGAVERNRTTREERERADRWAQSKTGWEQDWIDWEERL